MNLFARCSRLPLFAAALGSLACSGPVTDESGDGSVQGKFVETVAHYDDGTNTVSYGLRVNGDRRNVKELTFETAPDLKQLTEIKVWGTEDGDRIRVERYELVDHGAGLGTRRESLINAPPIPTTSMVMVMVNVGTGTGSVTVQSLTEDLFGNDPSSLKNYYLENSFGMHALTGQVMPTVYQATLTTCDTDQLADGLRAQVLQAAGVPEFDLYLWYFGRTSVCTWSGLSSGEDTFYNGSSGCVVLAQEPGHSFGFSHSSSLECHDASGNVVSLLDDPNQCTHNEYGNRYDTMGGGCRHFSAYQKVYRSYLQKCNGVNVRSSGTFTLHPIETPCDATQVLQVPMPHVRSLTSSGGGGGERTTELMHYLVELRSPIGFDSSMVPSVLINAAPDYRVFDPSIGRGNRGQHIWLLDMAPAVTGTSRTVNGSQHALAAGATFTDPAGGVSITTESVSATSATIRVEIANGTADPTCLDGTPFTAPGPASCGAGGAAGTAGTAGAPGAGGSAGGGAADSGGAAGSAGQPAGGTGAVPGAGGTNLTPPKDPAISLDEHGGCACRVRAERSGRDAPRSSLIGLALFALSWRRAAPNRKARAGDPIKPRSARRTG